MSYLDFESKYNKYPKINIRNYELGIKKGYKDIYNTIVSHNINHKTIVFECYPGVDYKELSVNLFDQFKDYLVINIDEYAYSPNKLTDMLMSNITDDRVFGVMSTKKISDFYSIEKIEEVKEKISNYSGKVIVYGFGAHLIEKYDLLIYLDMARWEIQQRFRQKELSNWKMDDYDKDILRKYKRGFFIEWRVADRIKKEILKNADFYVDTNKKNNPKLTSINDFFKALEDTVRRPFRLVPYFDPGVWGGQWMKEACNLDKTKENFAWSFDGVLEENSIYLQFGEDFIESPGINLVLFYPKELLGDKVHARFGTEFPIRFDLLDTVKGGNLSLQVHPLTEYIQENFSMHYTQDESYYILHAEEDAVVYLGLKENVNSQEMINDLKEASSGKKVFDAKKYINQFPAKKHDHFLIPAGTIHCSGSNTMVLEISATPYIFTFKLWDWGRLGLDGVPRPVHIEHGEKNIQWDRDTSFVINNLINQFQVLSETENNLEEKTGLHEREFIETRRNTFKRGVVHKTMGSVNVFNLIDGQEIIVKSTNNSFEPLTVNFAETFIIPESIKEYVIEPSGPSKNKLVKTIKAFVRT